MWDVPIINGKTHFISNENFEKYSVVHLSYYDHLQPNIFNPDDQPKSTTTRVKNDTNEKPNRQQLKRPWQDYDRPSEVNESYHQATLDSTSSGSNSTSNQVNETKCTKLPQKAVIPPSPKNIKDTKSVLRTKSFKNQTKFQQLKANHAANANPAQYSYIHPDAQKYIEHVMRHHHRRPLLYPAVYALKDIIPLVPSNDTPLRLFHAKPLLQLGKIPRILVPGLKGRTKLPEDYAKILERYPLEDEKPSETSLHKTPVSSDSNAAYFAEKHKIEIVISSSGLKTLVANTPDDLTHSWEIPIVVKEYNYDNGFIHKVVYIDKPFAQRQLSPRERNQLFYKFALKCRFIHTRFNYRHVPVNDDFFSCSKDLTDLEVFGNDINPLKSHPPKESVDNKKSTIDGHVYNKEQRKIEGENQSRDNCNDNSTKPKIELEINVVPSTPKSPCPKSDDESFSSDPANAPDSDSDALVIDQESEIKKQSETNNDLARTTMLPADSFPEQLELNDDSSPSRLSLSAIDNKNGLDCERSKSTFETFVEIKKATSPVEIMSPDNSIATDSDDDTLVIVCGTNTDDSPNIGKTCRNKTAQNIENRKSSLQDENDTFSIEQNQNVSSNTMKTPEKKECVLSPTSPLETHEENQGLKKTAVFQPSRMMTRSQTAKLFATDSEKECTSPKIEKPLKQTRANSTVNNAEIQSPSSPNNDSTVKFLEMEDLPQMKGQSSVSGCEESAGPAEFGRQVLLHNVFGSSSEDEESNDDITPELQKNPILIKATARQKPLNPLDEILAMQEKLLQNDPSQRTSCGKELEVDYTIDHSKFVPPLNDHNVNYNLWYLGDISLLIRCSVHGQTVKKIKSVKEHGAVTLSPKLEYQSEFGGEIMTKSEICKEWVSAVIRPDSKIMRVRVDVPTANILAVNEVDAVKTHSVKTTITSLLYSIFHRLKRLPVGNYLLIHQENQAYSHLLESVKDSTKATYDLHKMHSSVENPNKDLGGKPEWLPIDPSVRFPHQMNMRKPGMFKGAGGGKKSKKKKKQHQQVNSKTCV